METKDINKMKSLLRQSKPDWYARFIEKNKHYFIVGIMKKRLLMKGYSDYESIRKDCPIEQRLSDFLVELLGK